MAFRDAVQPWQRGDANTGDFQTITHEQIPRKATRNDRQIYRESIKLNILRARGQHDQNWFKDLLSFGVFTRPARRFPPASRREHERIPASIMEGLDDKWCEIYLFGRKQEFNSVRRILGACHLRVSHDASRALSASPTTLLPPSQTQDGRLRRGRCHSS